MAAIIGCDLGGTKTAVARFDADTLVKQDEQRFPTHADRRFMHVLEDVVKEVNSLRTSDTRAVGIGVPGLVRQPDGIVLTMPNIPGARNIPLQEELKKRLQLPVVVDNDANCFTLSEALEGAGKGHGVVVGITMGTGVGGGIVIDKKLFRGETGFAGEIGHMLLLPGQPPIETADHRGDVEQFLSGSALGKRCTDARRPEEYLQKGAACAFLHPELHKEIAWMCVSLVHVLDPSIIIFGGSVGRALATHLTGIHDELNKWLLPDTPHPILAIAELPDAATRGAAMLVR